MEFHDIEFSENSDLEMTRNMYTVNAAKDVNKHIMLYDQLIRMVAKDYKFKTLKEIAVNFNGS